MLSETVRQSPDIVRICVSRAELKLSGWSMTSYHSSGNGHRMAFSEVQVVSRLEVANHVRHLSAAMLSRFCPVRYHLPVCALISPGLDASPR